jgi:hypothetical protein
MESGMATLARTLTELAELSGETLDQRTTVVLMRAFTDLHEELSRQVTKEDFAELRAVVTDLAEAQKRTEERLGRLEAVVTDLAEAQKRTETVLQALVVRVDRVDKELGNISNSVGYFLEDRALRSLPRILSERSELVVEGKLLRAFVDTAGKRCQVNIWGAARRSDGSAVRVVGEVKIQLGSKHLGELERLLKRLRPVISEPEVLGLLVTSMAEPEIVAEAERRGWLVVFSYDLD